MIYLIPSWKNDDDLTYNRMLNIVKLFHENQMDYRLLLVTFIPFIRYKSNEYHFSGEYVRVYDYIQNISILDGDPVTLDDLAFSEKLERVYTFTGVLLCENDKVSVEVHYNKYGYVSEVDYHLDDGLMKDIWDDRGFLAQREHYDKKDELKSRDYFNEYGEVTIKEFFGYGHRVVITEAGNQNLKQREYSSIEDLIAEGIAHFTEENKEERHILVEYSDETMRIADKFGSQNEILDVFAEDIDLDGLSEEARWAVLDNKRAMVTDSFRKRDEILNLRQENKLEGADVFVVPMYNTHLDLGNSNSVASMIMYTKLGNLDDYRWKADKELVEKVIRSEDYSLILEVNGSREKGDLEQAHKPMIDNYFGIDSDSENFKKVAHYIEAKEAKELYDTDEKAVKPIKKTKEWEPLVGAVNAYRRIKYRVSPHLKMIAADFYTARIYINLSEKNDLEVQAQAVSSGIPQISRHLSYFIMDDKNGKQIEDEKELLPAADYFLGNLDHWNRALVHNVELIDKYSVESVSEMWKGIFNAKEN